MRQLVIKPGSIMLWKSYGKLKRWWYKLIGKNLPYNNGILIRDTQTILYGISEEPFSKESEVVILEPRKQYSKVETAFLNSIVYASSDNKSIKFTTDNTLHYTVSFIEDYNFPGAYQFFLYEDDKNKS